MEKAKSEGLLEFAAGEFDGAAPAGITYAAAGSSPGFFHQSAPRTSSAAAHTPEGKAVNTDGMHPGPPCAVMMTADAHLPQGLMARKSQKRSVLGEQLTHLNRYLCTKYIFPFRSA